MQRIITIIGLLSLLVAFPAQSQSGEEPPYLYYYSSMLGGLIIERADGTDSRHIAADVIPAGYTGLVGPGWSPSGKYFATFPINYGDYLSSVGRPYLVDTHGNEVVSWFGITDITAFMQWSPTGENILLIAGKPSASRSHGFGTFFYLVDANQGRIIAEFGINLSMMAYEMGEVIWDVPNRHIILYFAPDIYEPKTRYRVKLGFDGTTIREPITLEEWVEHNNRPSPDVSSSSLYDAIAQSSSGRYEAQGVAEPALVNLQTGQIVELPLHSQASICADFIWNGDETHIITMNGTTVAGGGCGTAVVGVTNSQGRLWRELGKCSWNTPCIGWLPDTVPINTLPPGAVQPVQLDPVRIDYETSPVFSFGQTGVPPTRLRCTDTNNIHIIDAETENLQYMLKDLPCPYTFNRTSTFEGIPVATAIEPAQELLAVFYSSSFDYVSIWTKVDDHFEQGLLLDSNGFLLEFTESGEYLRARNGRGWKVYAVDDILARIPSHEDN